ncbi:TonB-dependent receptor [candidate division KSB1 bacterium]|nr:MAG: TonB-dependent receptor [candidate division KSB1 bacterium]
MKSKLRAPLALLFCLLFAIFHSATAGTTGKITGYVTDADTQEPLPGANVLIEGTSLGDATDVNGYYVIVNLPPGHYTLIVSMMGYTRQRIENVDVDIDMTTTIDVSLSTTVLEAGQEVTIVAERPLVRLDMTSSLSSIGSDEIAVLPIQNVGDVLELQAGVIRDGGNLHIRGGRAGEIAYWIDGVATTDVFSGRMGLEVENNAVEELQVISGTFNAEYGQAMSGIINIVTKEGKTTYSGMLKGWVGDYVSNDDTYAVYKNTYETIDPKNGRASDGEKENPLARFNAHYNLEASLSGPLPLTNNKLTFFANGRYVQDEGYLYGREWFLPYGLPGDSSLVPMNGYERYSLQGKLTWRLTSNVKLSYNAILNHSSSDRQYQHAYKYNPLGTPQSNSSASTQIVTLNHVLSPSTFYDLKINRFYNDYSSYVYENPEAKPSFWVRVNQDTTLGIEEYEFDPNTPDGQAALAGIKEQGLAYDYITAPDSGPGYVHPDSSRQPVGYSFLRAGQSLNHYNRSTAYWLGKFDLTSQVNPVHLLKVGVEARLHELTLDAFTLQKKLKENGTEEIIPFEPYVPPSSTIHHDVYNRKPREFSAYIQDKIELKDIIINLGLRYDYFDANSVVLDDPRDPNIYDPMLDINRYVNPEAPEAERVEYTPDERRAFMHKKVDPKKQLSPRLGIAYPITDRGVIHFSYGHFFQIPEFQYLYDSPDFKFSKSGALDIVGTANLNPQRTTMYEIGLQQQLTPDIGIDVTLFYRDVRDWVGTGSRIVTYQPAIAYVLYENKDYANVRGITFKLDKRFSNNFFAKFDYMFQVAEGTYSNPEDAFNQMQALQEPRKSIIPLNWDQQHTVNASLGYKVQNWIISLIGRYWTGKPYTPAFARGAAVGSTTYSGLRENSARLPDIRGVDLTVNRTFDLDALRLNLFFTVYNVFDVRDETNVYSDTGTAQYTTLINTSIVDYDPRRIGTIEDYVNQPGWYTAPRQIQLGASIEF